MRLDTRWNAPWRMPLAIGLAGAVLLVWKVMDLDPRDDSWARAYLVEHGHLDPEITGHGSGALCRRRQRERMFQFRAHDASGSPTHGTLCCGFVFCNVRADRW